jgi:hypothetical protein
MLEDVFWESNHASSVQDDYYSSYTNLQFSNFFEKQDNLFNLKNRSARTKLLKSALTNKPPVLDKQLTLNLTALPIYTDLGLYNPALTNLKNFFNIPTDTTLDTFEDSYPNSKSLNYLYQLNYKNSLNLSTVPVLPISYTQVLDSFRPSYEENYLLTDIVRPSHSSSIPSINANSDLPNHLTMRLSNPLKIRSSAKSAIVTYNAIQKVFRSRFDEGRSNTRLLDFSNSFTKHPFLTDSRIPYENILGKNKESFLKTNLYLNSPKPNLSTLNTLNTSTNVYFSELPFLASTKSDSSRYLWFD